MNPKVSVIVPIYKVEAYLKRCIDSIINQSYCNLEIILVDDGSPDNCGKIADDYKHADDRIKVFHKVNGGLSDARNYGMQHVNGDFTLFVDSDDWLMDEMIQTMVNIGMETGADIVQTAFYYAYEDFLLFDNRYYSEDSPPIILDNKALMTELVVNERVKNFAWGKLYRTDIIKDIPFKKGVLFEDVFWAHRIMQRVNTYIILNWPMYYYFQRADSIVNKYNLRNLDIIEGLKERHSFIEQYYGYLVDESYKNIVKTCFIHFNLLLANRKEDKGGFYRREIRRYLNRNYFYIRKAVKMDRRLRWQLFLFRIYPALNVLIPAITKILRRFNITPQPTGLKRINL